MFKILHGKQSEAILHWKACDIVDVGFSYVLEAFRSLEAISGLCLEGLRVTWDHLGAILGHLEVIFEAILHGKACKPVDVDFTLALQAFCLPWRPYRGYVWRA